MAPARGTALLVALAGVGPMLAGVLFLLLAPSPSRSFGWFAYAPLQDARPATSVLVLSVEQCLGAGLIVLGVLVVAEVVCYRLGRARAASG